MLPAPTWDGVTNSPRNEETVSGAENVHPVSQPDLELATDHVGDLLVGMAVSLQLRSRLKGALQHHSSLPPGQRAPADPRHRLPVHRLLQ